MMLLTVEGTSRNGTVELVETPAGVEGAQVLVTFLRPAQTVKTNETATGRQSRKKMRERVLARMEQGLRLGGSPSPRREELYDRLSRYQ